MNEPRQARASSPWYRLEEPERADCAQSVSKGSKCRALRQEHEKAIHRLEEVGVALGFEQLEAKGCIWEAGQYEGLKGSQKAWTYR